MGRSWGLADVINGVANRVITLLKNSVNSNAIANWGAEAVAFRSRHAQLYLENANALKHANGGGEVIKRLRIVAIKSKFPVA